MNRNDAKKLIEKLKSENKRWLRETQKASMEGIFAIIERVRVEKKKDFILELIQNADDCDSDEISFDLISLKIIIQNDGDPFKSDPDPAKDNIFAICKLGRTTKESGKIGFMGFGFRAVFEVCRKPEIYSNNFSFYFDEDMIVPHWIEHIPRDIKTRLDTMGGKGSIFVLPNLSREIHRDVKQALQNLSPTLLLYLQHLKRIRIGREILQMDQGPFPNSFWVSRDGKEQHLWKRYYSPPLPIPKELKEFLRKDRNLDKIGKEPKKYEQISITFEIAPNGKIADKRDSGLYAFLPLADEKNTRFDFNIQADFSVDAGRRKLREPEGSWNQWILANVHKCIPSILKDYKSQGNLRTEFYKILPVDDPERPNYLNIVKKKIDEYIRSVDSVLTKIRKSEKHPDGKKWVKAKHAVIVEPELQKLFDGKDLEHLFGKRKFYVADDEIDDDGMRYIKEIVDDELSFDEIIRLLKDSRRVFDRKIKNRKNPEKWVGDLIIYFASQLEKRLEGKSRWEWGYEDEKREFISKLSDIKFLLTEDGKLSKLQRIFLPSSEDIDIPTHLRRKYKIVNRKILRYLEGKRITNEMEKERREKGLSLLKEIVQKLSPETIVEEIINPAFYGNNWKKYSDSTLKKYTDVPRKHEKCWEEARIKLKVQTEGKKRDYKNPAELYLPRRYGNEFDLDTLYKGYDYGNFVSLAYIKKFLGSRGERAKEQIKSWKKFLIEIGVQEYPQIFEDEETKSKEDIEKELNVNHPQSDVKESNWGYQKVDYNFCNHLKGIINSCANDEIENPCSRLKVVLKFIDKKWPDYKSYLKSKYKHHTVGAHGWSEEELGESSFARFLRESNWIPTKDGKHLRPSAIALSELKGIVKTPIIDYKISNKQFKEHLEKLGLQTKPTVEGAIALLKASVEQNKRKINRFTEIYEYLAQHEKEKKRIREELKDIPCIFTPCLKKKYWKISDVFWRGGEAFLEWKTSIEQIYPDLRDFFIIVLGVKEQPDDWDYVEFLDSYLWEKDDLSPEEKSSLKDVYHHLNYIVTTPGLKESDQWAKIKEDFKIWCQGDCWAHVGDEDIYYNDDEEIYLLFRNTDMNLAYIPKNMGLQEVRGLFEELGIKSLLENFTEKCSPSGRQVPAKEEYQKQIRRVSQYIARFVKHKAPEKFRALNKEGVFSRLGDIRVETVERLDVEACVGDYTVPLEKRRSFYSWRTPENCVYIDKNLDKDSESCLRNIGIAISNAFAIGKGIEVFIPYIAGKDDLQIEQAMQDYGVPVKERLKIEERREKVKIGEISEPEPVVGEEPSDIEEFEVIGTEELTPEKIEKHIEDTIGTFRGSEKKTDKKRIFREKKKIAQIKKRKSVKVAPEVLPSADKDLVEREIDGETVFLPPNEDPKRLGLNGMLVKQNRNKLCKIVKAMGGNPDTVNICWMDEKTDGFIENEQLIFNMKVIRNKPLIFWIVLVAREMAYLEHGHMVGRYALIKTMRRYIVEAHEKMCKKVYK